MGPENPDRSPGPQYGSLAKQSDGRFTHPVELGLGDDVEEGMKCENIFICIAHHLVKRHIHYTNNIFIR